MGVWVDVKLNIMNPLHAKWLSKFLIKSTLQMVKRSYVIVG